MPLTESIVRATVWVALCCYPAGCWGLVNASAWPRRLWSLGLIAFLIHVATAFGHFYEWSHAVGLRKTARQSAAVTGFESGAGLWLNYLFTLIWIVDVAIWWIAPERYRRRGNALLLLEHLFLLFLIFNATVVFEEGLARWAGLGVTVLGSATLIAAMRRRR